MITNYTGNTHVLDGGSSLDCDCLALVNKSGCLRGYICFSHEKMSSQKEKVLSLFRKILRMGRTWEAMSGNKQETLTEREYIINEARKLFRRNKDLKNPTEIEDHIKEGEVRIELAVHYRIPYPRQLYLQQSSLPPRTEGIRGFKASQKRSAKQSRPIYLKSYAEKDLDK